MSQSVGRNDPCPCGSGKKFKKCCLGKPAESSHVAEDWMQPTSDRGWSAPPPRFNGGLDAPIDTNETEALSPEDEALNAFYKQYDSASKPERIAMLRELLDGKAPVREDQTDIVELICDATIDIGEPDREIFSQFVVDLHASHPRVFNLEPAWQIRELLYDNAAGADYDVSAMLKRLHMKSNRPSEPEFDILSLLQLMGMDDEVRKLCFAMARQLRNDDYMPNAIDRISECIRAILYNELIAAGRTPEARTALDKTLAELECHPNEEYLEAVLDHRAGTAATPLDQTDVERDNDPNGFNLYLLLIDFGRWLATQRAFVPLAADFLRYSVYNGLVDMLEREDNSRLVLHRERLNSRIRAMTRMALTHVPAFATLVGLEHFYDYLHELVWIDDREHNRCRRICDKEWAALSKRLGRYAAGCAFLENLRPGVNSPVAG